MPAAEPIQITSDDDLNRIHAEYFSGSRLGALYGVGFSSKREEYHLLRGEIERGKISAKILERGLYFEPVIDAMIRDKHPELGEPVPVNAFYPHHSIPRFGVTPDRFVGDDRALEYKVVASTVFRDQWQDGPPLPYQLQYQAQLDCTGRTGGAIVALVIGMFDFDLEIFPIDRHDGAINRIRQDVAAFLDDVIVGNEPPIETARDAAAIAALYRDVIKRDPPVDLTSDEALPRLCAEYKAVASMEAEAKTAKAVVKARIFDAIGADGNAITKGFRISANNSAGQPGTTITPEMVGTVVGGRDSFRNCRITSLDDAGAADALRPKVKVDPNTAAPLF